MDANRERLARAMDARRIDLGLRWQQVAARAHMSVGNLSRIRNGSITLTQLAAAAIERALEWPRGTIDAYLRDEGVEVRADGFADIAPPEEGARIGLGASYDETIKRLPEAMRREVDEFIRFKLAQLTQSSDKPLSED